MPVKSFVNTCRWIHHQPLKIKRKFLHRLQGEPVSSSAVFFLLRNGRWGDVAVTSGFSQDWFDAESYWNPAEVLPVWLQFLPFCELLPSAEIISPALHWQSGGAGLTLSFFSFQTFKQSWYIWAAVIHRGCNDAVKLQIGCLMFTALPTTNTSCHGL